jgi:hypothetical protein
METRFGIQNDVGRGVLKDEGNFSIDGGDRRAFEISPYGRDDIRRICVISSEARNLDSPPICEKVRTGAALGR